MDIKLPRKQKGGTFDAGHALLCANKLIEIPAQYLIKTPPFQKVISLDKSKQDLLMHSVLAAAGAAMVLAASFAVASSGVTLNETAEYINHISQHFCEVASFGNLYDALGMAIDETKAQAPSAFKEVWGTMTTGFLNCARNLGQIWFLRSGVNGGLDLAKSENRQKRRKKQAYSNFISGTTNIPQLLEGLTLRDPVRIITAGSAVLAYFLRAELYDKSFHRHLKNKEHKPVKHINKEVPSNLMIGRGLGQTGLSLELLEQFGTASGVCIFFAGLGQTFGAVVMKYSDKSFSHPEEKNHGIDIM